MSGYVHGQTLTAADVRRAEGQVKHLQSKLDTAKRQQQHWSVELAKQRAATREVQQTVIRARTHHERVIAAAETEARQILMQAERDTEQVHERAKRQAHALRDRAYTDGFRRAHDEARARTAVLRNH